MAAIAVSLPPPPPSPDIRLLLPSSLQCLLAAHVARLCAALDGGEDYGLVSGPASTGQLPPSAQAVGEGGCNSPLALVYLQDVKGRFVDGERPPKALGVGMALKALELWTRARGLWEGSAVRDAWWVADAAAEAARTEQEAQDSTSSISISISSGDSGGSYGGGPCRPMSRGRTAKAAAADLRRRLAAVEAAAGTVAAVVAATPAADAASASTSSASPAGVVTRQASASSASWPAALPPPPPPPPSEPATPAAGAAAEPPEHVAWLRRDLAALEVEAAAEQLPPLSRTATAALCSRLAAAALARLHKEPVPHCRIADEGQARLLSAEALRCWRLALAPERTCQRRPAPPAAVRRLEAWWRAALAALAAGRRSTFDHLLPSVAAPLAAAGWPAASGALNVNSLVCGPCRGKLHREAGPVLGVAWQIRTAA